MSKRIALLIAALAPVLAAAAEPGVSACRHYDNRARFLSRTVDVEYVTVIAEACAEARTESADAAAPQDRRAAAERYLATLQQARAVIDWINEGRIAGQRSDAEAAARVSSLRERYRLVSPTGEYLILRQYGVFTALEAWVDTGASFSLASALP
jgi:hypothetical protein